jgi:hypothetical protein
LFEKAIAQARALPLEEHDALGAVLLAMTDEAASAVPLDHDARAAIREGLQQARRPQFAAEAKIDALWKRFDL